MSNIIEKELRGPIQKSKYNNIIDFANEKNWNVKKYKQISIYCDTDNVSEIGSVEHGNARLIIDIREDRLKLKIKVGNSLEFERKEYVVNCDKNSFYSLAALLKLFNITNGYIRTFDRTDIVTDKNVQFTIKLNCLMGDHFEIERNADDEETVKQFSSIIEDFDLYIWSKEELADVINEDHKKVKSTNIIEFYEREYGK